MCSKIFNLAYMISESYEIGVAKEKRNFRILTNQENKGPHIFIHNIREKEREIKLEY